MVTVMFESVYIAMPFLLYTLPYVIQLYSMYVYIMQ